MPHPNSNQKYTLSSKLPIKKDRDSNPSKCKAPGEPCSSPARRGRHHDFHPLLWVKMQIESLIRPNLGAVRKGGTSVRTRMGVGISPFCCRRGRDPDPLNAAQVSTAGDDSVQCSNMLQKADVGIGLYESFFGSLHFRSQRE